MPRNNALEIQPAISVERAALAGGVIAAAAELGGELCDLNSRAVGPSGFSAEYVLPRLTLPPLGGAERLGVAVIAAGATLAVERRTDGACVVTASGKNRTNSEALAAARAFGACLLRQLVLRRVVTVFRTRGFSVVQRCTAGDGAVTLRTRLPLVHQLQPSARTAPPEFAVTIDADGRVVLHLVGLHRLGRRFVEDTLVCALRETSPTERDADGRAQVHAA